jgi:hypothetical protein
MSTGKRLAKRSIVGTKVVVLREDGLYYPGNLIFFNFYTSTSIDSLFIFGSR